MIPKHLEAVGELAGKTFYMIARRSLSTRQMGMILLGMAYRCLVDDCGETVDTMINYLESKRGI